MVGFAVVFAPACGGFALALALVFIGMSLWPKRIPQGRGVGEITDRVISERNPALGSDIRRA
ncbi:hypothetical protein [Nocardia sp. NPDC052112]|uniref:hypothetical protein n=1 Tax=Nocardia sp. NPDC052112 TaxID=3155646 RepID=UPI0034391741